MLNSTGPIIVAFIIYLATMFLIGYVAWRRTQNSSDFFLGGRTLGPWPTALSACASDMSGWLLLGLPGAAFVGGMEVIWMSVGLLLGSWLNWLLIAKRLRVYSIEANDALTLPEFFANRFEDKRGLIQPLSAVLILLFFLFYTSSGLVAGGKLFETVFGFDYEIAVIVGAGCILLYTLFGGFLAVSWTDLFQGLLMGAALLIVPIVAIQNAGGFESTMSTVASYNVHLLDPWTNVKGQPLSVIVIMSGVFWGLGYFGQPHILARFSAIRSNAEIPLARRIAISWTTLSLIGAVMIGFAGLVHQQGIALEDSETIFIILVNALFHPLIAGILLAAILAAVMSTVDSQLLVSSSALAQDLYKNCLHKQASSKQVMFMSRMAVLLICILGSALAMHPDSSVLDLVSYAWAGFGAAFGPTLILSLYWQRMNLAGAIAGIITGSLTVVIWKQLSGGWFDLYEIIPGFLLATVAIILVSVLTKAPENTVKTRFNKVSGLL